MSRLLAFSSPSSTVLGRATRAVASANATTRRITAKRERTLHWRNNLDADSVLRSSSRLKVRALSMSSVLWRAATSNVTPATASTTMTPARKTQGQCHDSCIYRHLSTRLATHSPACSTVACLAM